MDFKKAGWVWVLAAVLLMIFGALILVRRDPLYVSPDETANAFFISTFAESGKLYVFESLNVPFEDLLHPRSVLSVNARYVPAGFLGLPVIYGAMAGWGRWLVPILTPLLAAGAVAAWYGLMARLFDREVARLSAILLALHPAWWYYAARGLMPNVPFLSMLIIGAWVLVARPVARISARSRRTMPKWIAQLDLVMGGVFLGWAVMIRPSEAIWMTVAALVLAAFYRKFISWRSVVVVAASAGLALAPVPLLHRELYGSAFATGYTAENAGDDALLEELNVPLSAPVAPVIAEDAPGWWHDFQKAIEPILPFGFHPRNVVRHMAWYAFGLFWWLTALALIGFPMAAVTKGLPSEVRQRRRAYLLAGVLASGWLFVLYGSWVIHDNPDPSAVSIANSYVRYWLPFFAWTTPFMAMTILWLAKRTITPHARIAATVAMVVLLAGLNVHATFLSPHDGLVQAAGQLDRSREIRDRLLELTEDDAVVIVDRSDKLFFPHRTVRYPLRDEVTYALMPRLVLAAPLYYYGITFPQTDVDYLNNEKLKAMGLQIEIIETFDAESLYRIRQAP